MSEAGGVTLVCWWCSPFCRTGNTRWGSRAALIVIALYASFDAGGLISSGANMLGCMDAHSTPRTCPRCGREVESQSGRGRPRIWCSDECRRRARDERAAAEHVSVPVRVVQVESARLPHLQAQVAELKGQLAETRKQRDAALVRAQTAERKLAKSDRERARLIDQNRDYRARLRRDSWS